MTQPETEQNNDAETRRKARVRELADEGVAVSMRAKREFDAYRRTLDSELAELRCSPDDFADLIVEGVATTFLGESTPDVMKFAKESLAALLSGGSRPQPAMRWVSDEEEIADGAIYERARLADMCAAQKWEMFLEKAFAATPVMEGAAPDQNPAIQAEVRLKSGNLGMGALSYADNGLLRHLVIGRTQDGKQVALEQFFDHDAIDSIGILRAEVKPAAKSTLFQG